MKFEEVKISSIAKFINGFPFKPEHWENDGYPIVRIQNLTDQNKPFNKTTKEVPSKYLVQEGDILVSWSATIDVFEWVREDALLNQHIFKVEFDPLKVDKSYFKLALRKTIRDLSKYAHGSTMKHVVKGDFDSHSIPLPSLDDQIRIAHLLGKVEGQIAQRKQHLQQLDDLLKSVFLEMFGDPVWNEKGWELRSVNDFSKSRLGKMRDKKFITGAHLRKYLGNSNVQWFRFVFDELLVMDFDEREREIFKLEDGDLLVCEGGEIGRCAIWKNQIDDCYFQKALHRLRLDRSKAIPEYIQYVFLFYSLFNGFKISSKATIAHLTGEKLKATCLPLPPIELQKKFAVIVDKFESLKSRYQQSLTDLESLYGALSQQAFKGELDLSRVRLD